MSAELAKRAVELLWKQWTALGVNGVAKLPEQAIDLEALIAFTPFLRGEDPRLVEESCDWCVRFGRDYASIARLKQLLRLMPPRVRGGADPVSILLEERDEQVRATSGKSRPPSMRHPSLLQLRSRCIFGVGARADLLARLALESGTRPRSRISEMRPTGYSKQAMSGVVRDLSQGGLLRRHDGTTSTYSLAKPKALRNMLSPLPSGSVGWAERFAVVAHLLTAWRQFGARGTYSVELARVLVEQRALVASIGSKPSLTGRPAVLRQRIDHWALGLLVDELWQFEWMVDGEDMVPEIVGKLEDHLVQEVQSDIYRVGMTELSDVSVHVTDPRKGVAEFSVDFSAQEYRGDLSFDGYLRGTITYDPKATTKSSFLASVSCLEVRAHFNVDDDDERGRTHE